MYTVVWIEDLMIGAAYLWDPYVKGLILMALELWTYNLYDNIFWGRYVTVCLDFANSALSFKFLIVLKTLVDLKSRLRFGRYN